MSTETKTEELRVQLALEICRVWNDDYQGQWDRLREKMPDATVSASLSKYGDVVDAILDVLRADPSAVIAALGGTQVGWAYKNQHGYHYARDIELSDSDDIGEVAVWVLGEQP